MVVQNYCGQSAALSSQQNPELHAVIVHQSLKPGCHVINANVTSTNHLAVKPSSDSWCCVDKASTLTEPGILIGHTSIQTEQR